MRRSVVGGAAVTVAITLAGGCSAIVGVADLPFASDAGGDTAGSSSSATGDTGSGDDGMDAARGDSGAQADSGRDGGNGDGGTGDGSTADGGSGDGDSGDGATTPPSCPTGALLCDSFESGSLDPSVWTQSCNTGATFAVDGTGPHRGQYSLHVHFDAVGSDSAICASVISASTFLSTPLFVRAFVATGSLPNYNSALWGFGPLWTEDVATVSLGGIGFDVTGHYQSFVSAPGTGQTQTSSALVMKGANPPLWNCLELEVDTSDAGGPNGLMQVWHDGTSTPDPQLTGLAQLPPALDVLLGLTGEGPIAAFDAYFDDVVVATQFIDCSQ
jgi:hypothetical protein